MESIQVPRTWELQESESWKDIAWKAKLFEVHEFLSFFLMAQVNVHFELLPVFQFSLVFLLDDRKVLG